MSEGDGGRTDAPSPPKMRPIWPYFTAKVDENRGLTGGAIRVAGGGGAPGDISHIDRYTNMKNIPPPATSGQGKAWRCSKFAKAHR